MREIPATSASSPAASAAPAPLKVRVLQVDTRDPYAALESRLRTFPGGDDHGDMRARYAASNPGPARPPYWALAALHNAREARRVGWAYEYARVTEPPDRHPSWVKIRHVLHHWDELASTEPEGEAAGGAARGSGSKTVVVVLDTDAWIRDAPGFAALLADSFGGGGGTEFLAAGEPSCRESREHAADLMNGGFLCFEAGSARVADFLRRAWDVPSDCSRYLRDWPWEQACLARAARELAAGSTEADTLRQTPPWLRVLPPALCNTPAGTLVTHCWYKDLAPDLVLADLLAGLAAEYLAVAKPTVEIVVARCGEDVDWIDEWLPFVDRITVYDKTPADGGQEDSAYQDPPLAPRPGQPKLAVVPCPNVGREAHAYALHFHRNDLCDRIVCTQAGWRDHVSPADFEAMVRDGRREPRRGLDVPWGKSVMAHFGWTPGANYARDAVMRPAGVTLGKYFLTHLADDLVPEGDVAWWPNAVFPTTARQVRRHSPDVYARILSTLEGSDNPEAAHMMERGWHTLLVPPDY